MKRGKDIYRRTIILLSYMRIREKNFKILSVMIIIILQTTYGSKSISIETESTDEVSLNDWGYYGWGTSKP